MKRLPPSIQEKQRYAVFRIRSESDHGFGDVVDALWEAVLGFCGSRTASRMDLWVIKNRFSEEDQQGVIKFNHGLEDQLRASLCLLEEIDGEKVSVTVEEVSGTLKSLENSYQD